MFQALESAFDTMFENLKMDYDKVQLAQALSDEENVNKTLKKLSKKHLSSIDTKGYDVKLGIVYRDVLYGLEKVGDHVINVTEGITGTD